MSIEYKLGKTPSGKDQLACEEGEATVENLSMHGFGDCVAFHRKNADGSTFGSHWGLNNLGCFTELRPYTRLIDMPEHAIQKLAARMYELLHMSIKDDKHYVEEPKIDTEKPKYKQILEELQTLQKTQKKLVASGEIVFPDVSKEELRWQHLW